MRHYGRESQEKKAKKPFGDRKTWCERGAPEDHVFLCSDLQIPESGEPCMMHPRDCCSSNHKDKCCALKSVWRSYIGKAVDSWTIFFSFFRYRMIEKENLLPSWILINIYSVLIYHALIFHKFRVCDHVPIPQTVTYSTQQRFLEMWIIIDQLLSKHFSMIFILKRLRGLFCFVLYITKTKN